jgi:2Fe-2S ferredoxin
MPRVTVLPHPEICPQGASLEGDIGENLCRLLLKHHIEIEHACELSRACTTCHVIVRQGFNSLEPSSEDEDDLLDRAWGLSPQSRLSCQVELGATDLEVELPRYTINHARENH